MTSAMNRFLLLAVALLAPVVAFAQASTYVVQPGDNLFRISQAHGLTVEELQELNGLTSTYISVGQTLRVRARGTQTTPTPAPTPPPTSPGVDVPPSPQPDPPARGAGAAGVVHVVQPGETLFRIALRYDTSVDDLRRLNGIRGDQIEIGQRLVVGEPTRGQVSNGQSRPSGPVALGAAREWSINQTTVPADLVHFVEPGETLYSIAAATGLEVDALARVNAVSTAPLAPGMMLLLPEAVNPAIAARTEMGPATDEGLALVYPDVMRGRPTASNEPYDPLEFTVSHRDYPFGTVLLITNPASGRSTFVRVIDRGPVSRAYLVELSAAAATALELDPNAARRVELREIP